MKDMKQSERPLSERSRVAGKHWAECKRESELLEEMRGPTVEQMKCALLAKLTTEGVTKVPESRLEREVKASAEYAEYIKGMCYAKEKTTNAWVEYKALDMEHSEMIDKNANHRSERKML